MTFRWGGVKGDFATEARRGRRVFVLGVGFGGDSLDQRWGVGRSFDGLRMTCG